MAGGFLCWQVIGPMSVIMKDRYEYINTNLYPKYVWSVSIVENRDDLLIFGQVKRGGSGFETRLNSLNTNDIKMVPPASPFSTVYLCTLN